MKYVLLSWACLFLGSCSLGSDNTCTATALTFANRVEGPRTARVNEDAKFTVYFQANNGCGKFDSFIEASQGDTVQVAPKARYEGCVCAQVKPSIQADYTFRATRAGKYYIKFLSDTTSFIVDTLVVQ